MGARRYYHERHEEHEGNRRKSESETLDAVLQLRVVEVDQRSKAHPMTRLDRSSNSILRALRALRGHLLLRPRRRPTDYRMANSGNIEY